MPAVLATTHPLETRAGELFGLPALSADGAPLTATSENLLLLFQAISVLVIVAGLIARIRTHQVQMEGVASMLLKVGIIATLPLWRDVVLSTADEAAGAIGFKPAAAEGPSPVIHALWGVWEQWAPPGSPYMDALEAQQEDAAPDSGDEEAWGLRAWNWARGVGAANADPYHGLWQSASGSLRATLVFGGTAVVTLAMSLAIVLAYLAEMLRCVVVFGGFAVMPVFVAGLGLESLRGASLRFILAIVSVAFWPVGWAVGGILTQSFAEGLLAWMRDVVVVAAPAPEDGTALPLVVAAPYVAWGGLLLFAGATLALGAWTLGSLWIGPALVTRAVAAGGSWVAARAGLATATVHVSSAPQTPLVRVVATGGDSQARSVHTARRLPPPAGVAHFPFAPRTAVPSSGRLVPSLRRGRSAR